MKLLLLSSLALFAALLAGCGGGGGSAEPDPVADRGVPATALASPDAFSHFVGSLQPDDSGEPVPLGSALPPTSETAEPVDGA